MLQRILWPVAFVLLLSAVAGYFLWKQSDYDDSTAERPLEKPIAPETGATAVALAKSPPENSAAESAKKVETTADSGSHDAPPPAPKPLLEGWQKPAVAFVLSGEQRGYIEPCGCSLNQLGGLSRRADLVRQIKDRGWPVVPFDVGGLVNNPARQQAKLKLAMALKSLLEMDYAGVALGREELQIGVENLLTFTESDRPAFLSSNLLLLGTPDLVSQPYRIVTAGDVRIGVTAVFGASMKGLASGRAQAEGEPADVEVLDPAESLTKALAALEAEKPDLLVLLSHSKREESEKLAEKVPQFDLILSAGGPEDPDARPRYIGKTLFVMSGQKGKHVGVVGYYPEEKEQRLRFELVALDDQRFKDTPAIQDEMRAYQESLQVFNLVANEPAIDSPWNAQVKGPNDYVGAKVCGECHTNAYKKWLETPHANATIAIKKGRVDKEGRYNDDFINRIHDPECVNCHVTGWSPDPKLVVRYKTGFESEQASPHLLGQQCENCHGPGGRHAELERKFVKDKSLEKEVEKFRELAWISLDTAGENLCIKCHDGDNDPHFKADGDVFAEYWKKIAHPWRD